ncbi:uncharacterized protein AMSG_04962 [Thecamonas trahens ATCC 50062]|uniref:Uncharacterized protein n=1 Tax=Thecamonas trahens ATCC 50062 TaxID=461836 RepID=A0A0L0DB42_THETB|nr:hypothetical protein AMSG_04962 [Thecamonas trahens ATCC 50062]KNC48518.1 hypothetical protein AMSG_04962 [Thecamonas trahens ATCC 50062]|eukprot:XP_013758626.1 hypothetical protein AMSG_04962 [Thecamonas trahens ATCC 50062]
MAWGEAGESAVAVGESTGHVEVLRLGMVDGVSGTGAETGSGKDKNLRLLARIDAKTGPITALAAGWLSGLAAQDLLVGDDAGAVAVVGASTGSVLAHHALGDASVVALAAPLPDATAAGTGSGVLGGIPASNLAYAALLDGSVVAFDARCVMFVVRLADISLRSLVPPPGEPADGPSRDAHVAAAVAALETSLAPPAITLFRARPDGPPLVLVASGTCLLALADAAVVWARSLDVAITALALAPDGAVIIGTADGVVHRATAEDLAAESRPLPVFAALTTAVFALATSPTRLAIATASPKVAIRSYPGGELPAPGHVELTSWPVGVDISNSSLITVSDDGCLVVTALDDSGLAPM